MLPPVLGGCLSRMFILKHVVVGYLGHINHNLTFGTDARERERESERVSIEVLIIKQLERYSVDINEMVSRYRN